MDNDIPFLKNDFPRLKILVVEDDRLERSFMEQHIKDLGHEMIEATDGQKALDILKSRGHDIDVILMDRIMPVLDGLSAVRKIKEHKLLRTIPVIMVTGESGLRHMQEGIDAGVFYYLAKPVDSGILKSVLSAALREVLQKRMLFVEMQRHKANFHLIESCKFRFRTLEQAESLSVFIAQCFPDPSRILPGLAELMINAIEHGLCEIGYDTKSSLIDSGTLRAEILKRQQLPIYKDLYIDAVYTHRENGDYVVITDPGKGFDWKKFMRVEPSRAMDNHGRGIAQANAISFDKLTFNDTGNQVVGYVSRTEKLEW